MRIEGQEGDFADIIFPGLRRRPENEGALLPATCAAVKNSDSGRFGVIFTNII
jgi:hypothetical protein